MFFNFLNIFAIFFGIFQPGSVGTEFWVKIFYLFLSLSHSVLDRNNAGMRFFNFLNFFAFFFWNFPAPVEQERNLELKLFSLFLGLFQPVLDRNNARMMFFNFLNFFVIFFLEFSSLARVGTEIVTKIVFTLSRPISSRFRQK